MVASTDAGSSSTSRTRKTGSPAHSNVDSYMRSRSQTASTVHAPDQDEAVRRAQLRLSCFVNTNAYHAVSQGVAHCSCYQTQKFRRWVRRVRWCSI